MKKINIIRNGSISNSAQFETEDEINSWLSKHTNLGCFGAEAYSYEQEAEPAVLDEEGNEITPAVMETIEVEAEYTVETSDITDSLAQEATNQAALRYLAESDYIVIRATERGEELSAEFKAERDAARLSIVR